ncbi:hypothetical protein OV208_40170 [Corallococcus sp. bb12-1]|uniref:hypothetical protein n=1 Tax=Corallococcus sp. bb12-1 TaxID=2996784 RepID=UPI0022719D6F|nr:hypothetical protein [Corallococcus sp. bb12-1]MCY1047585.1 hypothetical protein [Corallococcus sp. bb12-1]
MSTTTSHPAVMTRTSLGSGPGVRVTLCDRSGPVVSVWDPDRRAAWLNADDLERRLRALAASCNTVITRRPTR